MMISYLNLVSIHCVLNTALVQRGVLPPDIRNHLNPGFDQIFVVKIPQKTLCKTSLSATKIYKQI